MDVTSLYNIASAGYLTTQALPLLLTPRLIISMLSTGELRRMTDLEAYLSRSQAFLLLAFAALNLLLTGLLPTANSWDSTDGGGGDNFKKNPYAFPTVVVTTTYHALTAFYIYTQLSRGWGFAFGTGLIISATLFCMGVWVLLFGGEKGRISKKTGADKRTGNFPFTNAESSREIKKEAKEKERSKRRSVARTGSSRG